MRPEQWRPVPGFDGYEVSDLGRVRSFMVSGPSGGRRASPQLMHPSRSRGYLRVPLRLDGVKKQRFVHNLVLEAFIGPRPTGQQCCHGNGDGTDNRIENLRWDTGSANCEDKRAHGTLARGEHHGCAKLTAQDVAQIRAQRGFLFQTHLAEMFGVSEGAVKRIHQGRNWSDQPA